MLRHNIFMYVDVRKYYYLLMYCAKCNTDNEILIRYRHPIKYECGNLVILIARYVLYRTYICP